MKQARTLQLYTVHVCQSTVYVVTPGSYAAYVLCPATLRRFFLLLMQLTPDQMTRLKPGRRRVSFAHQRRRRSGRGTMSSAPLERSDSAPDLVRIDPFATATDDEGAREESDGKHLAQSKSSNFNQGRAKFANMLPTPEASPDPETYMPSFEVPEAGHETDDSESIYAPRITCHSTPVSRVHTPTTPLEGDSAFWSASSHSGIQQPPDTPRRRSARMLPFSLWDYLQEEVHTSDLDGSQDVKSERVSNFLMVPMQAEKVTFFLYSPETRQQRSSAKPDDSVWVCHLP